MIQTRLSDITGPIRDPLAGFSGIQKQLSVYRAVGKVLKSH